MRFKMQRTIRDLRLSRVDQDLLVFRYGGPHDVEVTVSAPSTEECERNSANAFCDSTGEWDPEPAVKAMFDALAAQQMPLGSVRPTGATRRHIDETGRIEDNYVVPLTLLPATFQLFASEVSTKLADYADRTATVLRWRAGAWGPHNPVSWRGYSWSRDGKVWRPMPSGLHMHVSLEGSVRPTEATRDDVVSLVAQGKTEPIGHELLREAWHQRHHNPRSAVVLGVAAVEAGIKQYISAAVPDARWLIQNAPSPDTSKIMKRYLPLLSDATGRKTTPIPDGVRKQIQKAVEARNKIVHLGALPLEPGYSKHRALIEDFEAIDELLLSIRDMLWILDYHMGHSWALDHIREDTMDKLDIQTIKTAARSSDPTSSGPEDRMSAMSGGSHHRAR